MKSIVSIQSEISLLKAEKVRTQDQLQSLKNDFMAQNKALVNDVGVQTLGPRIPNEYQVEKR